MNQDLLSRVVALEDFVQRSTALIGEILSTPQGQWYSTEQLGRYRDLMGDMDSYSHMNDSASNAESEQQQPTLILQSPVSVRQPAVRRKGLNFKVLHLIYYGPEPWVKENELKEPFQPNGECKGWC